MTTKTPTKSLNPDVERAFRRALTPDPVLTVSTWADKHRILSKKASSESGRWRTSRTPYLREIMDVLSVSHPAKEVVFKKASQVGGTECGNNWLGYIIDHAPGPTILVYPNLDTSKRNSKLRIAPLIDENPRLKARVSRQISRESGNTVAQKDFENGVLIMAGANSAAGLKSTPCRFAMLDELDEFPLDCEGQGDPISLVLARSRTFPRRKAYYVSTPTIEGLSKICSEFEDTDQRHYYIPCPHCDAYQTLKFENLSWPGKGGECKPEPKKAAYFCEACGEEIQERFKTKFLEAGQWRAHRPGHDRVGFFINSLYSPIGWFSWAEIADEYEKAKKELEEEKKTEKMKAFTNTVLGLAWSEPGESPEWKRLYLRREKYRMGTVPDDALFLTCGVDVQKDRLEAEVVAWCKNKISYSVTFERFLGDPSDPEVWDSLTDFLGKTFETFDGKRHFPIKLTGIDSGYSTQNVYNYVRKFSSNRVIATKGRDDLMVAIGAQKAVDAKLKGKVSKRRGVKVWNVGSSHLKGELYGWLKLDPPIDDEIEPTGFCHFPEYEDEFFRQLTAEKLVTKRNERGYTVMEWVKERERNEALDCRVIARACASLIGLDRMRDDKPPTPKTENPVAKLEEAPHTSEKATEKPRRKRPRRTRESSGFWG